MTLSPLPILMIEAPVRAALLEDLGRAAGNGAGSVPTMLSATALAMTTASSSELLARRLAPCRPLAATSPQAHRPSMVLRPSASATMPPMW